MRENDPLLIVVQKTPLENIRLLKDKAQRKEQEETEKNCKICGSEALIDDKSRGERICTSCGAVQDIIISSGPEWRAFTKSERNARERVGAPASNLKIDKGLRTQIGAGYKDITGKSFTYRMWRIRFTLRILFSRCRGRENRISRF